MAGQLPESFSHVEIGKIVNIDVTTGNCDLVTYSINSGERTTIPYTLPYAGRGWGILVGPEEGSRVVIGYTVINTPYILAYLPNTFFYSNEIEDEGGVGVNEFPYQNPRIGEIVLQSKANSSVSLNDDGDARIDIGTGTFLELNRGLETIIQESVDVLTINEAGKFKSGVVRRDIREEAEKELDALFGNTFDVDVSRLLYTEIIGQNPEYVQDEAELPNGLYDPAHDSTTGSVSAKNPALTEMRFEVEEYADSNVGLDEIRLTDAEKAVGKMEINRLTDLHLGTVSNDFGKILRFDHGFGKGSQGHGKIYSKSTDFFFNKNNTLKSPQQSANYERYVEKLNKTASAILLKMLLHTKGADFKGNLESKDFRGALWSLLIDKEGLTKLEVPAATDLGDSTGEPGRAGKSVIANLNGSLTLAVGKEKSKDTKVNNVLASDVTHSTKGRLDRSITLDAEGNIETVIGADAEKGQSWTLKTDGSIEGKIGKDTDNEQSIKITTDGGINVTISGPDNKENAINLNVTGNINQTVTGDINQTVDGDVESSITGDVTAKIQGTTVFETPEMKVGSDNAKEHFVLGDLFMKYFNTHVHVGNMGAPTLPPTSPMLPAHLSKTHTTE